jgi:hypothetical protein
MLENKASGAYVSTTHHRSSDAIEHLRISFQQRRTLIVSIFTLIFFLSLDILLWYNLIIIQIHLYLLLILVVFDVLLSAMVGWLTAEPLAILAYLRAVQREQQTNSRVYTPLMAVENLYETPSSPSHRSGQKDIREIAKEMQTHLLILGLPGAGKTMALRAAYQFPTFKRSWSLARGPQRIPVYVPMKDYNAFLRRRKVAVNQESKAQNQPVEPLTYPESLLTYLQTNNGLVGLNHLRPYMQRLAERGRLFFLYDGLNEVDGNRLGFVCHELMRTMQAPTCHLAMTCRELDYREEPVLHQLVGEGGAEVALILPLRLNQIESFIEQYRNYAPEQISKQNKYSTSEIIQRIKQSRLSYNCTNPMMLVTLMQTIDELDNETLNVGTRGLLLSKYISRLITAELQRQGARSTTEGEVVLFLSHLAFTARCHKLRNAILLGRTGAARWEAMPETMSIPELAAKLQVWLDDHALPEMDVAGQYVQRPHVERAYSTQGIEQLTLFTQGAGLITISYHGVLSFRHELIAEYFVANYLYMIDVNPQAPIPFGNELVADIGAWSEPIAMWAGMSHNPMELAKRIANLAQSYPQHSYNALSLSLVCAGVRWGPQEKNPPPLPENVSQLLVTAVHDVKQRERLAERLKHSADEGGTEQGNRI